MSVWKTSGEPSEEERSAPLASRVQGLELRREALGFADQLRIELRHGPHEHHFGRATLDAAAFARPLRFRSAALRSGLLEVHRFSCPELAREAGRESRLKTKYRARPTALQCIYA